LPGRRGARLRRRGDGPCVILATGARTPDEKLLYPVSELAARYGASAEEDTPTRSRPTPASSDPSAGGPRTGTVFPGPEHLPGHRAAMI
jgi:hypothetical protein